METFIVICKDTGPDGVAHYCLTTRRLFYGREAASAYAQTISPSREALVVEGRFEELREARPWVILAKFPVDAGAWPAVPPAGPAYHETAYTFGDRAEAEKCAALFAPEYEAIVGKRRE